MQCIAFDAHKRYTRELAEDRREKAVRVQRDAHRKEEMIEFLTGCERGSPVAIETIGDWHRTGDEIEAAGMVPRFGHAGRVETDRKGAAKREPDGVWKAFRASQGMYLQTKRVQRSAATRRAAPLRCRIEPEASPAAFMTSILPRKANAWRPCVLWNARPTTSRKAHRYF